MTFQRIEPILLGSEFPLPLDAPFTAAMAVKEGLSPNRLTKLVSSGALWKPIKNVYVATQLPDSTMLRADCLSLVAPADCVIVGRHAGWLHGAEMVLAPNEHLELQPICMFRPSGHGRLRNKLADSGERNLIASDITEINGLAVSTPLRTTLDLGRTRWRETSIAGMDAMLRLGLFEHGELLENVDRFKRQRWVTVLRELAPWADGRAESPGESVLRLRWIDCGLPTPTLQLEVYVDGILVARLDLGHEELLFAAEYDGAEWHSSPEQKSHDAARRGLLADHDWIIEPFVAANVFGRRRDCDETLVRRAMEAQARLRGVSLR